MRLTEKDFQFRPEDIVKLLSTETADIYNKLRQLEDIEDELEIDLVTLFKAQKEGIWELGFNGYDEEGKSTYKPRKVTRDLYIDAKQKALVGSWVGFGFSDYGKKEPGGWALTKEELL